MKRRILTILGGVIGLLVLVYLLLVWRAQPVAAHPFFDASDDVLVIAHQGGEQLWPSNTFYAFERAAAMGVDVLEMDVHSTADGVLVLMHDDTVDRTTGATGRIQDLTLAEIKALDAGYYWTDDDGVTYPYRGQGITVPTLEEVLAAFPDYRFNIEIKKSELPIAPRLCDLLRQYDVTDQTLVGTFYPEVIADFRDICPEVATSGVEAEIRPFFVLNTVFLGAAYQVQSNAYQVPEYSGDLHVVTERFVRGAHGHNVDVHVWTVNDTADMERLLALGVDGIITDRPDRLMDVLGRPYTLPAR